MDFSKFKPRTRRPQLYMTALLEEARRLRYIESHVLGKVDRCVSDYVLSVAPKKKSAQAKCEASVRYVIGYYLRTKCEYREALDLLCTVESKAQIAALFEKGEAVLRRRYQLAASRYIATKQTMLQLPNLAYQKTISEQIPRFLKQYRYDSNAHMEELSLSYPTALPIRNLSGLTRILRYLYALYHENLFLQQFPKEELEYLYLSYCFTNRFYDVEVPIVNLYRIVLKNAVIAEYLRLDPGTLILPSEEVETAQKILTALAPEEQKEILRTCAQRLFPHARIYYDNTAESILNEIIASLQRHKLQDALTVEDSKKRKE